MGHQYLLLDEMGLDEMGINRSHLDCFKQELIISLQDHIRSPSIPRNHSQILEVVCSSVKNDLLTCASLTSTLHDSRSKGLLFTFFSAFLPWSVRDHGASPRPEL